ncbi:hypothetical protein IPL85_00795 [Candidatus Saccharibacteria bacterium]|nr:MAG: hypothetical protein IPL85_00795 [Candidatus Saccharibacteria bacterium]
MKLIHKNKTTDNPTSQDIETALSQLENKFSDYFYIWDEKNIHVIEAHRVNDMYLVKTKYLSGFVLLSPLPKENARITITGLMLDRDATLAKSQIESTGSEVFAYVNVPPHPSIFRKGLYHFLSTDSAGNSKENNLLSSPHDPFSMAHWGKLTLLVLGMMAISVGVAVLYTVIF